MEPLSPVPAIAALLAAIATCELIARRGGAPTSTGRFATIDGLRGYLAFFVFLHHSSVWFQYLRTHHWRVPASALYTQFGQSSVALFFMITGFLFFSKLIDGRRGGIDWGKLFVSRVLRLVPLYLVSMALLFLIVAVLSGWSLHVPGRTLAKGMARWLCFTIPDAPNLNAINDTFTIIAGVTWSLPYEWLFYLSLPLLALTTRALPPIRYLGLSVVGGGLLLAVWRPTGYQLMPFAGGMLAAVLVRSEAFRAFCERRVAVLLVIASIAAAIALPSVVPASANLFLLSAAFALIAGGCSLFGALLSPASRVFGEMAYSIYLLHGILLFAMFTFVIGRENASQLSPEAHWAWVIGASPLLVLVSGLSYRFIERPAMRRTTQATAWLRTHMNPRIPQEV